MACHRLNEQQPVLVSRVDDHIGQFAVVIEHRAMTGQEILVEEPVLVTRIANIDQLAPGRIAGAKVLDDIRGDASEGFDLAPPLKRTRRPLKPAGAPGTACPA